MGENTQDALLEAMTAAVAELKKLNQAMKLQREMPSTPLLIKQLATEDSARYVYENFPHVNVFRVRQDTLRFAVDRVQNEGLFLEFGVNAGQTINQIGKQRPDAEVYGFDSFEGLPEDWGGTGLVAGRFDQGGNLPKVPDNVKLVKGWFNETVPVWKKEHTGKIAFCHVDCDLYSSTVTIFTELEERFEKGTIIVFDEYFGYSDWRNGEHKAFLEMIERTGFGYKALAVSHMAFVVELT